MIVNKEADINRLVNSAVLGHEIDENIDRVTDEITRYEIN